MSVEEDETVKRLVGNYMATLLKDRTSYAGRWMAFRLSNGDSNGVAYETHTIAKRFTSFPAVFLKLQPDGIKPRAARTILRFHRGLHDRGLRLGDPDAPIATPMNSAFESGGLFG